MQHPARLSSIFLAHRGGGATLDDDALEARLREIVEVGRAAWPEIDYPAADFTRHLAQLLPAELMGEDLWDSLRAVRAADLYLAGACAGGLAAALLAFDRRYLTQVPLFLARQRPQPVFADEVCQVLREKLFVAGPGRTAKIGEYSGRGSLENWLRVTALRTAVSLRRNKDERLNEERDAGDERAQPAGPDPELDYLKARYLGDFQAALQAALSSLSTEQRNLLRMHLIDGLSIDHLSTLFQVHRATAARWLAACRQAILDETRRLLRERLQITPSELDSLIVLLRSQVQVSIKRHLREA